MPEETDLPRDLGWYQARWMELMDVLPSSNPEDVVDHVRSLQLQRLDDEQEALDDLKVNSSEDSSTVLRRIFDRLKNLRRENQNFQEIRSLVDADSTTELTTAVKDLKDRLAAFEEQQAALEEAGFEQVEAALEAVDRMEEQLNELYGEKEVTEKNDLTTLAEEEGDTFDQLQALLAREEKLQRELGVAQPDDVIEMVESLSDQLEELYRKRDSPQTNDSIFAPAHENTNDSTDNATSLLEEELGVSDPDMVSAMVQDLTEQLETVYDEREQLAEYNLGGPDEAARMVTNMQQQLEILYESQEQMSEHGIEGIEYAISVIENMEAQLGEIYEDRRSSAEQEGPPTLAEATHRLETLEKKLVKVTEEKEHLREKRDRLQSQFAKMEARFGTGDPDAISAMIDSLGSQLEEVYEKREMPDGRSTPADKLVLDDEAKNLLLEMEVEALRTKSIGVFGLDDAGIVQSVNDRALQWPDVESDSPESIVGENFFQSVAPGASSTLFRGRFDRCVDAGEMDEQFSYTYVDSTGRATNLSIYVFSAPSQQVHWIAFRVLERY